MVKQQVDIDTLEVMLWPMLDPEERVEIAEAVMRFLGLHDEVEWTGGGSGFNNTDGYSDVTFEVYPSAASSAETRIASAMLAAENESPDLPDSVRQVRITHFGTDAAKKMILTFTRDAEGHWPSTLTWWKDVQ
jgi:hypothetical protein